MQVIDADLGRVGDDRYLIGMLGHDPVQPAQGVKVVHVQPAQEDEPALSLSTQFTSDGQ